MSYLCFKGFPDACSLLLLPLGSIQGIHQGSQLLRCVLLDHLLHLHQNVLCLQVEKQGPVQSSMQQSLESLCL